MLARTGSLRSWSRGLMQSLLNLVTMMMIAFFFATKTKGDKVTVIRLVTSAQTIVVDAGRTVNLECKIEAWQYNMFEYPVFWVKAQRSSERKGREECQVNMMGNTLDPFAIAKRHKPTFTANAPHYFFSLEINDARADDTANYTCRMEGPQNSVIGEVVHNVIVRAPVNQLTIASSNSSRIDQQLSIASTIARQLSVPAATISSHDEVAPAYITAVKISSSSSLHDTSNAVASVVDSASADVTALAFAGVADSVPVADSAINAAPESPVAPTPTMSANPSELVMTENEPSFLRCLAVGGNPSPDVSVFLAGVDITHQFSVTRSIRYGGTKCMNTQENVIKRQTQTLVVSAEDDGATVDCIATVAGLEPTITSIILIVHHAPVITCHSVFGYLGDLDVTVRCEVKAKPEATAVFWDLDLNESHVQAFGESKIRPDGILEAQLHIEELRPESFRSYTLIAENVLGSRKMHANVKQKHRPTGKLKPAVKLGSDQDGSDKIPLDIGQVISAQADASNTQQLRSNGGSCARPHYVNVITLKCIFVCLVYYIFHNVR